MESWIELIKTQIVFLTTSNEDLLPTISKIHMIHPLNIEISSQSAPSKNIDVLNTSYRVQLAILRNSQSESQSVVECSFQSSRVFGLMPTLNALHSASRSHAPTCIVVIRIEDPEIKNLNESKHKVSDVLKAIRQLGLFAMEYGGVFVGSVRFNNTLTSNDPIQLDEESISEIQRVLKEALKYQGPSLVLLNSDCRYRWIPEVGEASNGTRSETDPFDQRSENQSQFKWDEQGDIKRPPALIRFLDAQQQVHLCLTREPRLSDEFVSLLPETSSLWQSYHHRLLAAAEAPDPTAPIRRLLILFGSDGGHAEGLARRIQREAPLRGVQQCLCLPFDSISDIPSSFKELKNISKENVEGSTIDGALACIIATAGQGEFPGNAKKFWKRLASIDSVLKPLEGIRYGVFGLGDSLYWPREPIYFCKSSKDADGKLYELGGERLVDLGLGDDQETDKYERQWRIWNPKFWTALGWERHQQEQQEEHVEVEVPTDEAIKVAANHLRGTLKSSLDDITTGQVPYEDQKTIKFHGIYQQDHRDYRSERASLGLEPFYSFMARVRLPGGICTPSQWLKMDELSTRFGDKSMKITTRQTFQLHGLLKRNLKKSIQEMNRACMDTITACGDVNRNVLATSAPGLCSEKTYELIQDYARQFSEFVLPHSLAYHEIFLEGPHKEMPESTPNDRLKTLKIKVGGSYSTGKGTCPRKLDQLLTDDPEEPLYGRTYLPRKFKVAVAIPPINDVDVFAHCVGFIADIVPKESPQPGETPDVLTGFTISVGGGMGTTHNDPSTYPRLGELVGYCHADEAKVILASIMAIQRDHGDRNNRRHARFKYTVEDLGVNKIKKMIETLSGIQLQLPKPFTFTTRSDPYGWIQGIDGNLHYGLFIEGGRVVDTEEKKVKTCLREIAKIDHLHFRLTCNQNLIISGVDPLLKSFINEILRKNNCEKEDYTPLRLNSIACVALPTCPLAMAESERYLPSLVTKIEKMMHHHGIQDQGIVTRMTGCPNGCSRPYISEIGLVGRSLGFYDLHLGGDWIGQRLAKKYKEGIDESTILIILEKLLKDYSLKRHENEAFGDFCCRHLQY